MHKNALYLLFAMGEFFLGSAFLRGTKTEANQSDKLRSSIKRILKSMIQDPDTNHHLPPDKGQPDYAALSRQSGYANQPKDIDWLKKNIPCQAACPAKTRVPNYLKEIYAGNYNEAYLINLVDNIFPSVLGRVCSRPCEPACRHGREGLGQPVAICLSKRAAGDLGSRQPVLLKPLFSSSGKTVAIIGAGPAGLTTARELALFGHKAIIFEQHPEPGGFMNQGIPEFRLPRMILRKEIEQIKQLGVEIRCNQSIGAKHSVQSLLNNHDAVVIAAGTTELNQIENWDHKIEGIQDGLIFLHKFNMSEPKMTLGRHVAVIGGGFTAMDCARAAVRLGSIPTVYYQGTRKQISISNNELKALKDEGIELKTSMYPISYQKINLNGATKINITFDFCEKPNTDQSDYCKDAPKREIEVIVDTVVAANGERRDTTWIDSALKHHLLNERVESSNEVAQRTTHPSLFLAGDYSIGASSLIDAIGHAKSCARKLDEHLMGEIRLMEVAHITSVYETGRTPSMNVIERQPTREIPAENRTRREEVELGYNGPEANVEAVRCYLCHYKFEIDNDACIYCDKCLDVKPHENCIVPIDALHTDQDGLISGYSRAKDSTRGRYQLLYIDQDECTRCGRCEKVCPVDCISIQKVTWDTKRACDLKKT